MNRMFGTVSGETRAYRRGLGVLGTVVSLGLVACAGTDTGGMTEPTASTTSPVVPVTPTSTTSTTPSVTPPAPVTPGVTPPVTPPPVTPNTPPVTPPVTPVTPVTPGTTPVTPPTPPTGVTPTPTNTSTPVTPTTPPAGGTCTVTPTGMIAPKVNTVGVVTFTTDQTVTSARIEFKNMAGGDTLVAPVDVNAADYRTLLLGMKPNATYSYKVIVNDDPNCASAEGSLTTGMIPTSVAAITKSGSGAMKGFYVVSVYAAGKPSLILDQDGDIVWYGGGVTGNEGTSRSRMDYNGKYMWSIAANPFPNQGAIRRVSMDGEEDTTNLPGTELRHHDLTALPDGSMTFLVHLGATRPSCSKIVELSPAGAVKEVVGDINEIYKQVNDCHPNSIHYHSGDDTYTLGDREASLFVKIKRDGELIWQLGGGSPMGDSFAGAGTWNISHGHHLFEQAGKLHMLVFNNNAGVGGPTDPNGSKVLEFELDETAMTANKIWTLGVDGTTVMGDVQRLPNDNTMVAMTTKGVIREVGPGDATVNEFTLRNTQIGYVDYRPTLYGKPTKANLDYKNFE